MKKLFLFIIVVLISGFFFVNQASAADYIKDGKTYEEVKFEVFPNPSDNKALQKEVNEWCDNNPECAIIDIKWEGKWPLIVYIKK